MSTTEKKNTTEPVDKEAIRELINELEHKLDALYTLSDEVNRGILESKDALESVREKRVKVLRARLDRIFQQWNIGSLTSNHHPYVTSELCAFDAEYGFRAIRFAMVDARMVGNTTNELSTKKMEDRTVRQ
ncbi:hypothetical protein QSH57_001551 [Fusarium oxysporum f. sp. vasinfectum]|nr:hypothetical protein QSH57_001551 [Fusarium oxysporum f. sp. vasinfectum]